MFQSSSSPGELSAWIGRHPNASTGTQASALSGIDQDRRRDIVSPQQAGEGIEMRIMYSPLSTPKPGMALTPIPHAARLQGNAIAFQELHTCILVPAHDTGRIYRTLEPSSKMNEVLIRIEGLKYLFHVSATDYVLALVDRGRQTRFDTFPEIPPQVTISALVQVYIGMNRDLIHVRLWSGLEVMSVTSRSFKKIILFNQMLKIAICRHIDRMPSSVPTDHGSDAS